MSPLALSDWTDARRLQIVMHAGVAFALSFAPEKNDMNRRAVQRFCLTLMACLALATCSKNDNTGTTVPPTGIVVLRLNGTTGALDPAFGSGKGIVVTDPDAAQFDFANAVALQTDGKILSAGRIVSQGLNSIGLIRQNIDGSLDKTAFGLGTGIVRTPIVGGSSSASAIAVQPLDGKILVAAITFNQGLLTTSITLARYTVAGVLDASFNPAGTPPGTVTAPLGPGQDSDTCGLALQTDGKIVVAGASTGGASNGKIFLYRYDSAGVLDPLFGAAGTVTTDLLAPAMSPAIALQADGKIVLVGGKGSFSGTSSPVNEVVVRYNNGDGINTDGTLDTTFGGTGIVTTDIGFAANFGSALLIQADGKIVTAGHASVNFDADTSDISLVRYNTNGTLDTNFVGPINNPNPPGIVTTDLGGFDNALSIAFQATTGKFIVAGNSGSHGLTGVAVLRYNADGSLDSTSNFGAGGGGVAAPPVVGPSIVASGNAVVVQGDGNIVVAGYD
jgi:uncharacterized delta-60 repeat protein